MMNTIDTNKTMNFYFHWRIIVFLVPFVVFLPLSIIEFLYMDRSSKDFYVIVVFSVIIPLLYIPGIKYFLHFLSSKPVLILTGDTFFDYRTGLTIYWSDIDDLKIVYRKGAFISVKLKNAEVYISKCKNPFYRFFLRLRSKMTHGTFRIRVSDLKGESIYDVMDEYLNASNKSIPN
jgi:hypothetical protein